MQTPETAFCGVLSRQFFNSKTWDFGECYQDVFLFGVPCLLLLLGVLVKLRAGSDISKAAARRVLSWSTSELILATGAVFLALLSVIELVVVATMEDSLPGARVLSAILQVLTMAVATWQLKREISHVVRAPSWLLFFVWTLFSVGATLRFRTEIRKQDYSEPTAVLVTVRFVLSLLVYVALVMGKRRAAFQSLMQDRLLVHSTVAIDADEVEFEALTDLDDEELRKLNEPNEEETASFFSLLTFSWMNGLFRIGYREKKLVDDDFAKLAAQDRTATVMRVFDKYYYGLDMSPAKAQAAEAKWKQSRDALLQQQREKKAKETEERQNVQINATAAKSTQKSANFELQHSEMRIPRRSILSVVFAAFQSKILLSALFKLLYDSSTFVSPQLLKATIGFMGQLDRPSWHGYLLAFGMFGNAFLGTFLLHQYFHIMIRAGMNFRTMLIGSIYRKSLRLSPAARGKRSTGEIVNLMSTDAQRLQDVFPYVHMTWSAPVQIILAISFLWVEIGPAALVGLGVMVFGITPLSIVVIRLQGKVQRALMTIKDRRVDLTNETLSAMRVLKMYAWETRFGQRIEGVRDEELVQLRKYVFLKVVSSLFWTATPTVVSLTAFAAYTWFGHELTAAKAFTALALFNIIRFPLSVLPIIVGQLVEAAVSLRRVSTFLASPELPLENSLRHRVDTSLDGVAIELRNGTFFWDDEGEEMALENIDLTVPQGALTMVIGSTGAGKSALLQAVIGELRTTKSTSVRVSSSRVSYAAQSPWIQNATVKDNILFGKKYDARRYDEVIFACALEADFEALPAGDQTEIGEKGINLSGGQKQRIALARAVYMDADIVLLDDVLSAVDAHVGQHIFEHCIQRQLLQQGKTVLLCTNSVHFLGGADHVVCLDGGTVQAQGSLAQVRETADVAFFASTHDSSSSSVLEEEVSDHVGDHLSDHVGDHLSDHADEEKNDADALEDDTVDKSVAGRLVEKETVETGAVGWSVYRRYIDAAGGPWILVLVLFFYATRSIGDVATNRWLAHWSDQMDLPDGPRHESPWYLSIYAAFSLGAIVTVLTSLLICAVAQLRASRRLHEGLLRAQLRAPMSFFDTTPTGRILNRFTQDLFVADERLPSALQSYLWTVFSVLATLGVIVYVTPWFALAILPMSVFYYLTSAYYLPTQRDLRRWMSVSVSPVYSHFGETLDGASTVRALGAESAFATEAGVRLNRNMRSYYPGVSANRWLAVRLEFCGTVIASMTALLLVVTRSTVSPGVAGLALSYALSVTSTLNWMVRMTAERETNIVSVERIQEYSGPPVVPSEAPLVVEGNRPPATWPSTGAIELQQVEMRYREGLPLVLKGLNASIRPREKVGIVGRTGAGKSSMFQMLLRLVEPLSTSRVLIDGVDVGGLGLHDLRGHVSIIPQDPALFSGTVRYNLDPFESVPDRAIWTALEQAHLAEHVRSLPMGLDTSVREGGSNFSVGQRQLLCLARALLRQSRVLLLDEATSAVDVRTDALVQKTIRSAFADRTVLTIAHRLDTVLDADRIAVMKDGVISEFDSPDNLLARPDSEFAQMAARAFGNDVQQVAQRVREMYRE